MYSSREREREKKLVEYEIKFVKNNTLHIVFDFHHIFHRVYSLCGIFTFAVILGKCVLFVAKRKIVTISGAQMIETC